VVVIGGGAAGLMCAIEAGKRGRSVIVLERSETVGKKIRISGGGRCNFTNVSTDYKSFLSENPDFARSALARFTPADFIALVERHEIAYHEKTLGQLFCDHSAQQIIDMLVRECRAANVTIQTGCRIEEIKRPEKFTVRAGDSSYECEALVIATGGISVPTLGATDFGYKIARQFGLKIVQPRPGLVPLTFGNSGGIDFSALSGTAMPAVVELDGHSFKESLLFTHRGLSGPAILQISSYWKRGEELQVDAAPEIDLEEKLLGDRKSSGISLHTALGRVIPKRFAEAWCDAFASRDPLTKISEKELKNIAAQLHAWKIQPTGTEGFGKAEVTAGGVDTRELSSKTMEARKLPGLYFIGEVVDVTGHLGGYNFQWAWSSGVACGRAV
jgi:predicted Rossmann fold flavoprotein